MDGSSGPQKATQDAGLVAEKQALEARVSSLEKRLSEVLSRLEGTDGPQSVGSSMDTVNEKETSRDHRGKLSVETNTVAKPGEPLSVASPEISAVDEKTEVSSISSRVKIVIETLDSNGERVEKPAAEAKKPEAFDLAFVLKKTKSGKFSDKTHDECSEIDIKNPELWSLLSSHLSWYPYHMFRGPALTLYSPYEPIVTEWNLLEAVSKETPEDPGKRQAHEDLDSLLKTIGGGSSGDPRLDKYFKSRDLYTASDPRTISFEDLWTVFPPGTLIYGCPFQNQDQLFIVDDNTSPWPSPTDRPQQYRPWMLNCWTYDWDTSTHAFRRTAFIVNFEQFEGHRPLNTLPFRPFDALPDAERAEIKKKLIERGKVFKKLCGLKEGESLFDYTGDTVLSKKGISDMSFDDDSDTDMDLRYLRYGLDNRKTNARMLAKSSMKRSSHIESKVMVDYQSYFMYGPATALNGDLIPGDADSGCTCADCETNDGLSMRWRTRYDDFKFQMKSWEDEQYMLCPPRVLGYILKQKQWAQLQVDLLSKVAIFDDKQKDTSAWSNRLQLADDDTKGFLLDLVKSHVSSSDQRPRKALEIDDMISQKGKGLIILLYGPPGVGKTSTAETIAEASGKPLFSISVSDVGTNPQSVEARLKRVFDLATNWQAILLIDEADVFLESRAQGPGTSAEKNALVAVFLRVLEYYQGIMFLTTNQIAQFDIAIPSRIHVAIKYETLSKDQMRRIFRGFLDPLDDEGLIEDYEDMRNWLTEDVFSLNLDGRQIRNIVTTALGLARAEMSRKGYAKGKLTQRHLKRAVKNTREFKSEFVVQFSQYRQKQNRSRND